MGTKEEISGLFRKLIDETITAEELNRFFTYVKHSKDNAEIQQPLAELWGYVELTKQTAPDGPDNAGGSRLRKNIRLLDLLTDEDTSPEEIDDIIEKIVKGYYS